MGRWARTVRVRATIGAVVVVGVASVGGAVALVSVVHDNLVGNVRNNVEVRAREIASTLTAGGRPGLAVSAPDEQLIQVLDADGGVLDASTNLTGRPAVADLRPGDVREIQPGLDEDPFLAVAVAAGPVTVVVARALSDPVDSTMLLVNLLVVGIPVLLAIVGATTWLVVGRSLAPVAAITREVDAISAAELHRRVPEPGSGDEIAALAHTMNRMLGRLQHASASQRRFVSDASHELRTPVATIRHRAEVAQVHPDRTTVAGLAGFVQEEAVRLQVLIDDLLLLARVDEAGLVLRRAAVDLDDVVFAEAARLRATTPLRIDVARVSAGRVVGDQAALRRMVRNLADNAARHATSAVALAVRDEENTVSLLVDDDGPGIPVPERQRVLGRFVRLADARARDEGGTGLGLAIVAEIAAAHGGTFLIADAPLGGARAHVVLPAAPEG
jgi:signal transduction histidine kinase